jgi:hypothetical protein
MVKGSLTGAGINTVFVQRRRGIRVVVGLDEISTIWCEVLKHKMYRFIIEASTVGLFLRENNGR